MHKTKRPAFLWLLIFHREPPMSCILMMKVSYGVGYCLNLLTSLTAAILYLQTVIFAKHLLPNTFPSTVLPKDGDKVKVGKQKLTWHALDSNLFNVKLFRFASNLQKQIYGVLFWAVTVINCPEDIPNVRISVGSNSASMWWLNGEEAVILSGDRRMVKDDCLSKRLTLKKGKNIIRGAIINGPGMSDFCIRLLDEKGAPIKNITISYK